MSLFNVQIYSFLMKAHPSSDAHSSGLSKAVKNLLFILNAMFLHKNFNPVTPLTDVTSASKYR